MKKFIALVAAFSLGIFGLFSAASCTKSSDTLTVYTEAGFAPFEYVKDGQIVGVDVDIMNAVGEKLGKKVVFESVDFDTIIDAVAAGKLTKVGSAGISVTESRKQKVNFSDEYYTAALYVIYPAANASEYENMTTDGKTGVFWESFAGKTVAVQNGTTADLFLGDELADGGCLFNVNTEKTGFSSLATALADVGLNSDVLIIDELPAKKLIEGKSEYACAPLYYYGGVDEDGGVLSDEAAVDVYAIAVNKNETELLKAINEVLATIDVDALVSKHLGV